MRGGLGDTNRGSEGGLVNADLPDAGRRGDDLADMPDAGRGLDGWRNFEGATGHAVYFFQVRQNPIRLGDLISGLDAGKHDAGQLRPNGCIAVGINEVGVDAHEYLRSALAGESHALTKG